MNKNMVPATKNAIQGFIDDATRLRIEFITKRLSHSVTPIEIINWLGNFKAEEQKKALDILEYLEYVTESELIEFLDNRIKKLLSSYSSITKIIVLPVGEFGKSGTLLTYYFKKTPSYSEDKKLFKIIENQRQIKAQIKENLIQNDTLFVLLDDFLGSGKSVYKFYKALVKPQLNQLKTKYNTCILSVYHLNKADTFLNGVTPELKIISELKYQCFSKGKSPYGYYNKLKSVRDLAYYYGQHLFEACNQNGVIEKHPLGFKNSQALVVFPYNPPNNTLPIIWSSSFIKKLDRKWIPLYPRNQLLKMAEAKSSRNELAYELGLLRSAGNVATNALYSGSKDIGWKGFNYFKTTDFKLFSYIRLSQQKRVDQTICIILGITLSDLEGIKNEGLTRGVLDANGKLSQNGALLYYQSIKQLKRVKKELARKAEYEVKDNVHIPKIFNGRARNAD